MSDPLISPGQNTDDLFELPNGHDVAYLSDDGGVWFCHTCKREGAFIGLATPEDAEAWHAGTLT